MIKLLLLIATGFATSGCSSTADGHKTFLGIAKYDKHKCVHDQWVLKKKQIVYQKCFK